MSIKTSVLIVTPIKFFTSILIAIAFSYLSYLTIRFISGTGECPVPLGLTPETTSSTAAIICQNGLLNTSLFLIPFIMFIASLKFTYSQLGKVLKY